MEDPVLFGGPIPGKRADELLGRIGEISTIVLRDTVQLRDGWESWMQRLKARAEEEKAMIHLLPENAATAETLQTYDFGTAPLVEVIPPKEP